MASSTGNSPALRLDDILALTLQVAVPLHILEMRHCTDEQRLVIAVTAADVISSHGDDLQYGGKHCAPAFTAVAHGLAVGAYQPGGVTFAGLHWCTAAHPGCPAQLP